PIDDILIVVFAEENRRDLRAHLHGSPWLTQRCAERLCDAGFCEREELQNCWLSESPFHDVMYRLLPQMRTERGAKWLLGQPARWKSLVAQLKRSTPGERRALIEAALQRQNVMEWFRTSARVAIVGPPNAGKSTLLNALASRKVALVSDQPGTTRDWLEVESEADGFPVTWIDTAGLRESEDPVEAAGIARTRAVAANAEALVLVLDATALSDPEYFAPFASLLTRPTVVALNKIDLLTDKRDATALLTAPCHAPSVAIAAAHDDDFHGLFAAVFAALRRDIAGCEQAVPFDVRLIEGLRIVMNHPENVEVLDALFPDCGESAGGQMPHERGGLRPDS
ncbi:MAG: GTPase, partial [Phycisphaerae bacterium]